MPSPVLKRMTWGWHLGYQGWLWGYEWHYFVIEGLRGLLRFLKSICGTLKKVFYFSQSTYMRTHTIWNFLHPRSRFHHAEEILSCSNRPGVRHPPQITFTKSTKAYEAKPKSCPRTNSALAVHNSLSKVEKWRFNGDFQKHLLLAKLCFLGNQ